jgi:hypothetical protein
MARQTMTVRRLARLVHQTGPAPNSNAHLRRSRMSWVRPGVIVTPHGRPFSVMAFTVKNGKIIEIDT